MEAVNLFPGKNQSPPPSPHSLRLSVSSIFCGEEPDRGGLFFWSYLFRKVTVIMQKE